MIMKDRGWANRSRRYKAVADLDLIANLRGKEGEWRALVSCLVIYNRSGGSGSCPHDIGMVSIGHCTLVNQGAFARRWLCIMLLS